MFARAKKAKSPKESSAALRVEQGRVTYLLQVEQRVVRAAPHHPTLRNRRPPALGEGLGEGGTVARERLLAVGPHLVQGNESEQR